jgi:hypothetical protein
MSRRFSPSLRLKLQVVFAKAWEALAETYRIQAAAFVHRDAPWLPVDEALDRYFREVGVPAPMIDTVRARALIALAPLIDRSAALSVDPDEPAAARLTFRLDQLVGTLRQRAQYVEETNLQCRLAACVTHEAVAAAHVRMALEAASTLDAALPPDEAIMHYVRTCDLPALEAQIIFQRAMAQWAERHAPGPDAVISSLDIDAVCASAPTLELVPAPSFGLRLRAQT